MNWDHDHIVHVAGEIETPADPATEVGSWRRRIEPWLSALFQAEHLSLLLGNGFTTAIAAHAGSTPATMGTGTFGCPNEDKVNSKARENALKMGRGDANIEDQLSVALNLLSGLQVLEHPDTAAWQTAIERVLKSFAKDILAVERGIRDGIDRRPGSNAPTTRELLISFLMSFASRSASRERLQLFTTNYDRVVERGCDHAGLRIIDRFVGSIEPEFRSSRLHVDMHYTPPGVRGEPRHLEGVIHFTKLHGSLDWRHEHPRLYRAGLPFGAEISHPEVPKSLCDSLMIYPNAAKDIETVSYPYADLFRDFSSAICQPNNVLVTYGYGFGDDHINRVISDMLTIPSTHLAILAWGEKPHDRIASFIERVGRPQQLSLLLGKHFGDLRQLVEHYLPKPAIDPLTIRMGELVERRGKHKPEDTSGGSSAS